jgi:hypothetical protein
MGNTRVAIVVAVATVDGEDAVDAAAARVGEETTGSVELLILAGVAVAKVGGAQIRSESENPVPYPLKSFL